MWGLPKQNRQNGFTLIELVMVIAIIGILSAIAIPKFTESSERAKGAKIQADLRTIDSAISLAMVNGATIGDAALLPAAVTQYLSFTPQPPAGNFQGPKTTASTPIPAASYGITTGRATLGTLKAEDI